MTPPAPWSADVYRDLRRLAGRVMAGERADHTLEPTALTHEVWLRLRASRGAGALDPAEFLGVAAQAMRRILCDHARGRAAAKRGGGAHRTTLAGLAGSVAPTAGTSAQPTEAFALDLDAALAALERCDPELARLVELRFYGGASTEELAAALGTSPRTIKRRWRFARAWLRQSMQESAT